MPRLIDADALKIHIKDIPTWQENMEGPHPTKYPAGMFDPEDIISAIDEAPTLDVAPVVHGRWAKTREPMGWEEVDCVACTVCGESWILREDDDYTDIWWHYCPNCGAKMDKEDNDD